MCRQGDLVGRVAVGFLVNDQIAVGADLSMVQFHAVHDHGITGRLDSIAGQPHDPPNKEVLLAILHAVELDDVTTRDLIRFLVRAPNHQKMATCR